MMEGRARLIWTYNTANAMALNHVPAITLGNLYTLPDTSRSKFCLSEPARELKDFYSVDNGFSILSLIQPSWKRYLAGFLQNRPNHIPAGIRQTVLPLCGVIHTRDWTLVKLAVKSGIPTIYEDHNESFHQSIREYSNTVTSNPAFRLAVGISQSVRDTMILKGMPPDKTVFLQSGVNSKSLQIQKEKSTLLRSEMLARKWSKLAVYSGGLYEYRGIDLVLELARKHPDTLFCFCGGRGRHAKAYRELGHSKGLNNVHFTGYLPHSELSPYLQAADVLLLPYSCHETARITSPLKFFEYMASGTPVAAVRMPALMEFTELSLAVTWSEIGDLDSYDSAFRDALKQFPFSEVGYDNNRMLASKFTWEKRQETILEKFLDSSSS